MINKVVQWQEWGEVKNVYAAYNFSHFFIYLQSIIKIDGNLTKFWHKQFCTDFSETRCIYGDACTRVETGGKLVRKLCWILFVGSTQRSLIECKEERLSDYGITDRSTLAIVVSLLGGVWPTVKEVEAEPRHLKPADGITLTTISDEHPDVFHIVYDGPGVIMRCGHATGKLHLTCVFIFVLLGKNIGRQTATRIHEQKA